MDIVELHRTARIRKIIYILPFDLNYPFIIRLVGGSVKSGCATWKSEGFAVADRAGYMVKYN